MARWEYFTLDLTNLPARTNQIDLLDDAGEDAWELWLDSQKISRASRDHKVGLELGLSPVWVRRLFTIAPTRSPPHRAP
jgi:hypothetical protein